jgi:hypothetical protein
MPAFIFVVVAIERSPPFPTTANLLPHPERALLLLLLLRLLPKRRREARRIEDIIILFFVSCEEYGVSHSSVRTPFRFCLFKNSFFRARKKDKRRKISYSQKSSRAIRVILYTRILARILARTTRAQTNLFVSVSFEREREKIEKEREKSFSLCLFVCVCV